MRFFLGHPVDFEEESNKERMCMRERYIERERYSENKFWYGLNGEVLDLL